MTSPVLASKLPTAAYDNKIYSKFSSKTIEKKNYNKGEFQKEFGLIPEKKTLLLGFSLPLTEKNGADILAEILPGIEKMGIQVAFLGIGTKKYQEIVTHFSQNDSHFVILENTDDNMRKLYAAADSMLFFHNTPETVDSLKNALSYGVIPLAPAGTFSEYLSDYNPNQEKGNSFLFQSPEKWQVFAAVVRAIENYKFPYDWKNMSKEAMEAV